MTTINVQFKGVRQFQKSLLKTESTANRKAQQALNRTLTRSRTQMTNAVGEKLNLKKKTIREQISLQKANKNTGLIGKLIVKNKHVPLIEYKARQNRKGVSFKMFKDKPRQLIHGAFITDSSKHVPTVFKRESKARLKIKPLYGVNTSTIARNYLEKIKLKTIELFHSEIIRLLKIK